MKTIIVDGRSVAPSKIVCIGRNYVAHVEELGNEIPDAMVVFNKPNSALSDTLHSHLDEPLHYEGELCFAVYQGEFNAVGFGLDLTKRELQSQLKKKGLPWERAKAFDGAAVISQFVALPERPDMLSLRLSVDGELRQSGGVELMLYQPTTILRELKKFMTLEDGDIVMTGTPAGVGVVQSGEQFTGQVRANETILLTASWVAK
jgi:2-keto-4-pentenoate hydratase/2-oxohepta-3-ene-1,7-dioic acid hydratase in catechol pathway